MGHDIEEKYFTVFFNTDLESFQVYINSGEMTVLQCTVH